MSKTIMAPVTLGDKEIKALCNDKVEEIGGIATWLLTQLGRGGMMLSPDAVSRIDKALGDKGSEASILAAVEASVGRDGDTFVAKTRIDPVYLPALEERAHGLGMSVQQLIQDCMDFGFAQGWAWDLDPTQHQIVLTHDQHQAIQALTGKQAPTGADVVDMLNAFLGEKQAA